MRELLLTALDGSNPLAYFAALGTLRLSHLVGHGEASLRWERNGGFWRPILGGFAGSQEELCDRLMHAPWSPVAEFRKIGKNLTVPPSKFASFVEQAQQTAIRQDRRAADFAAAFGCETCIDGDKGRIEYTDLCFITGSGHQDFLGTIDSLAGRVTEEHLNDALFGKWRVEKGLSMRWDPEDASEYALQWDDPGPKGAWAVWGANKLASEALPLFPSVPTERRLQTTGFRRRLRQHRFTYPIWTAAASSDTVCSLLSLNMLQEDNPDREVFHAMGIAEVFRAQRVRIGQGANFKVSFRQTQAV